MFRKLGTGAFALLLMVGAAQADVVHLRNGDRLTGKVKRLSGGVLTIKTEMAGSVKIDVANIKTFATDEAIEIRLSDQTVLNRPARAAADGHFAIEGAGAVQPQTFALTDVESINPPKAKWTGGISVSATATRGNSDTNDAIISVNASRRSEIDRISFDAAYEAGRQKVENEDGSEDWVTTRRSVWGALQYDYFFSSKLYGWGRARAEKDAIANLDLRLTAGAGGGYQWHEDDVWRFSTEAGLAWFSENFANETPDQDSISGRLAYKYSRALADGLSFDHDVEWYRSLEDSDDNFVTARAGLRASLTSAMFAEFKVALDWDSSPAAGAQRTDTTYMLGVGWSF